MLAIPIQNPIAFNAKFNIAQGLKPKNQRFQNSEMTKKEIQLSKGLEQLTPLDKSYKLVLSSIDWCKNQYFFKLLDHNKKVAKGVFDFNGNPKNSTETLTEEGLYKIYNNLKSKANTTPKNRLKKRIHDEENRLQKNNYFFKS